VLSIQAGPTTVVIHLGSGFIRPSWEQVVTPLQQNKTINFSTKYSGLTYNRVIHAKNKISADGARAKMIDLLKNCEAMIFHGLGGDQTVSTAYPQDKTS
jgi:hypothetical protein